MVKAHREVFARLATPEPAAVLLDTPYGFQTNAHIVSDKAVAYFRDSVGRHVTVAGLRRTDTIERVELERALAHIGAADWLFTGPGSPSFALRQWRETPVPTCWHGSSPSRALVFQRGRLDTRRRHRARVRDLQGGRGPVLVGGPRPAVPLRAARGRHPPLRQHRGRQPRHALLLPRLERLEQLEQELPADAFVLGVDEHTALLIDLDADEATILGRGGSRCARVPINALPGRPDGAARRAAGGRQRTAAATVAVPQAPRSEQAEHEAQPPASVAEGRARPRPASTPPCPTVMPTGRWPPCSSSTTPSPPGPRTPSSPTR